MNKVTNLTLPSGETVEIQDSHAITLDENTSISGTFDFGKVTGAGNYNVPLNALNGPSGVSVTTGTLKVLYDNNKPIQIYLHRVTNQIFVRSLGDNGSWNSWVDITATNSLQAQIDTNVSNISKETQGRVDADASIMAQLRTETSNRSSKDTELENMINSVSATVNQNTSDINTIDKSVTTLTNNTNTLNDTVNRNYNNFPPLMACSTITNITGTSYTTTKAGWLLIGSNFTSTSGYLIASVRKNGTERLAIQLNSGAVFGNIMRYPPFPLDAGTTIQFTKNLTSTTVIEYLTVD